MPIPLLLRSAPIRLRLAAGYATFVIAVIAVIGVYLLTSLESNLQREVDESLGLRASHVEDRIETPGGERLSPESVRASVQALAPTDEFSTPGIYVEVLDADGTALAYSPNLPGGQLPTEPGMVARALGGESVYASVPAGRERVRVLARPLQSDGRVVGVILVGESLHLLDIALRRTQQFLLLAGASAVVVAFVGGWWLTARAMGPIASVTHVAQRIASTGQFGRRLTVPPTKDELGELTATFNDMLARLERTFLRQREFLADASHELRGPLAVIQGNLDLLRLNMPEEDRQESAREAAEEARRMSRLVSDLLFLSEVDAHEVVRRQKVALHEVVAQVLARAVDLDGGKHEISLVQNDPCYVEGDHERLVQLLWNLVENAIRYTPTAGTVTISLERQGHVGELKVADSGIGIPSEHLSHIFERFYRVDKARSRHQGGTGLGLAIVKQVAEIHSGQVRVRSEPGEGTVFTVALPVLPSQAPS